MGVCLCVVVFFSTFDVLKCGCERSVRLNCESKTYLQNTGVTAGVMDQRVWKKTPLTLSSWFLRIKMETKHIMYRSGGVGLIAALIQY